MRARKLRRVAAYAWVLLLIFFARPDLAGTVVGLALIIPGELARIWAAGHIHKSKVLTVTGPYAYVKNPLYLGTILIVVGFCIFARNVYLLALATSVFCFHYIPSKSRVESARMRKRFGAAYDDYDEKVPDYIPRLTPYSGAKGCWRLSSFLENGEEGILLIVIAGIALVFSRPYWRLPF